MAESRQELVNWINDLLLTNITKVEQCGTGAIFCQIFDSIYLDVPMQKVRFDVNNEYQYLNNFKVLQSVFTKYHIDRSIPVERLVKCRFQDNLEFLQWTRRYWEANFPGHEYDPLARRKGPVPISAVNGGAGNSRPASRNVSAGSGHGRTSANTTRPVAPRVASAPKAAAPPRASLNGATGPRRPAAAAGGGAALTAAKERVGELEKENSELISAIDLVESERDFYFQKLRDIEVLIQTAADQLGDANGELADGVENLDVNKEKEDANTNSTHAQLVREIQTILYSTTEGFEIPTQEYETEETF
jgi:RP/EB family microtubule-associated protein